MVQFQKSEENRFRIEDENEEVQKKCFKVF